MNEGIRWVRVKFSLGTLRRGALRRWTSASAPSQLYVIHANSVGEQVTRKYVADFIFNTFQIKMDHTTVGDKLKECGFTFRKHGTVNASRKKSNAEMVGIAYDTLAAVKRPRALHPPPSKQTQCRHSTRAVMSLSYALSSRIAIARCERGACTRAQRRCRVSRVPILSTRRRRVRVDAYTLQCSSRTSRSF